MELCFLVTLKGCHFDLGKYRMDITVTKRSGSPGVPGKLGVSPNSVSPFVWGPDTAGRALPQSACV